MNGYINFDRFSDAMASLEQLCDNLGKAAESEQSWKFAVISAHCALQGFMCIALHNGNSFDTWKNNHYKKWQKAYDAGEELPDPQLDFFLELYNKLFPKNIGLDLSLIEFLNETRNGMVHFNTDSYSIEKKSIVLSIRESLKAIELTPSLAKGIFYYEEDQEAMFKATYTRANSLLNNYYNVP
ncbi:TPA: hypothetical protein ACX3G9_004354 [Vibrio parahaemolyticus]